MIPLRFADAVALAGTLLAAVFLVPQIVRLRRRGDVAGLSLGWAALGVVTNGVWVAYLAALDLWAAVPAPACALAAYCATLRLVARLDRSSGQVWLAAAWAVLAAGLAGVGGTDLLGPVLSVVAAAQLAPAVIAAFGTRRPSGLSPATWTLAVAEAGAWALYGMIRDDSTLVVYGLLTATGALLVVGRAVSAGSVATAPM